MREHTFHIPHKPRPKERGRRSKHGGVYTPEATKAYEAAVAACYDGPCFDDGQIEVTIVFTPDGSLVTIRESDHEKSPIRGDIDNLAKSVLDALQGKAFNNDRQVQALRLLKSV